jgi:hypothetical protein
MRCTVINAACLVAGLLMGLGTTFVPTREQVNPSLMPTTATTRAACPPTVSPAITAASGSALSLSDIRNVIREEIQAGLLNHLAQQTPPKEQLAPPYEERTGEERQQRYEKASQVLRRSLSYGTWTQEDRREIQSILHELTVPQQDQLVGDLFTAIQSGKLKVEGSAPPL